MCSQYTSTTDDGACQLPGTVRQFPGGKRLFGPDFASPGCNYCGRRSKLPAPACLDKSAHAGVTQCTLRREKQMAVQRYEDRSKVFDTSNATSPSSRSQAPEHLPCRVRGTESKVSCYGKTQPHFHHDILIGNSGAVDDDERDEASRGLLEVDPFCFAVLSCTRATKGFL
ncbi:hypothetical protein BC629DRAFT_1439714 [Irpex lacteus]|nr:hypothetical protein BC629DRAFT_1439714 [Irpex lacteus]